MFTVNHVRRPILSGVLFLLFVLTVPAFATIWHGQVLDAHTGQPIANATLQSAADNRSWTSDDNGDFSLQLSGDDSPVHVLVSRLGYYAAEFALREDGEAGNTFQPLLLIPKPIALEEIYLTAQRGTGELVDLFAGDRLQEGLPNDVAEVFANTPGYGVVRKGAYGSDPVIRGFKRDQLQVRINGIGTLDSACPNRMDPVTAQIQPADLKDVQVTKGPYSLRYGTSFGGVVNLSTHRPTPSYGDPGWQSSALFRYEGNGEGKVARASLVRSDKHYGFRISGGVKDYGNVTDGDGNEIPSSFSVYDYTVLGALRPAANHMLDVLFRQSFGRDIEYAGLPMDAAIDDATLVQGTWRWTQPFRWMPQLELAGYMSQVDHEMDNLARPNAVAAQSVANTSADTYGGRLETLISGGDSGMLYVGVDNDIVAKDGQRRREVYVNTCTGMTMDPPVTFYDGVWQDVTSIRSGVFTEWEGRLSQSTRYQAGARFDMHQADSDNPATQFISAYGSDLSSSNEAVSVTASIAQQVARDAEVRLSLGQGTRFPSLTELYINHLTVGQDAFEYFGNPNLKPEMNRQVDLSFGMATGPVDFQLTGYVSFLTDAITAQVDPNLPRLYMPCMDPQNTKRFVNVDEARVAGFDWTAGFQLHPKLHLQTSLAYTWAQNITDDEPMPEIPPFEGRWTLHYALDFIHGGWIDLHGRHVSEQTRVASSFGEQESDAFNVFDVRAGMAVGKHLRIVAGVQNVLDEQYREHLNRNYKNQYTMQPLYEPGRNVYLQLGVTY